MAYSDFKTFKHVTDKFPVTISSDYSLFVNIPEIEPSAQLQDFLEDNIPLALNINTEKARSELMVMPVLLEVRKQFQRKISLFSGIEFTVDTSVGLNGFCDFILSNSPTQLFLKSPVICMVEAKNNEINPACPQCIAEMIAAQRFNAAGSNPIDTIWGVVSNGYNWKFLRLDGNDVKIDYDEYGIPQVEKILGIFQQILSGYQRD
ncbi:MAG: hypothetical protein AAF639_32805 [Chloroflexota bacterium]